MPSFDLIVLGAGSGGIATARRAASYGASVCVIEKSSHFGGTCVNVGCVPKKVMWNATSIMEAIHDSPYYGFSSFCSSQNTSNSNVFDWRYLKAQRDSYIKRLNGIYSNNLSNDGIQFIQGIPSFTSPKSILIQGNPEEFHAKYFVVATGGHPKKPSIPGAEFGITSDEFFELENQPEKVAVVGGGYIGVELSGIFNALHSKVTLFNRYEKVLHNFDSILGDSLSLEMESSGIEMVKNVNILKLCQNSQNGMISIEYEIGSECCFSNEFDCVIWAVGRGPNVAGLNCKEIGIVQDNAGHILVDEFEQSSVEHIFALGDVTGKVQLTPVAIAAGRTLSDRVFGGKKDAKLSYEFIPTVVFSHPPLGTVGYTEEKAREMFPNEKIEVFTSKFTNMYFALMPAEKKQSTVFKMVTKGDERKIIGLHLFGKGSDEILQGFAVAIKMGATKADFDRTVAIHPTAAEEIVTMK